MTPSAPGDTTQAMDRDFRRVHPLSPLLRVGVLVVAGVLATWRQVVEEFRPWAVLATVVGFAVVGVAYGWLTWWFTRFRIDTHELRIDSGVLLRRSRRIRIDRLQGVDVVQPLLARLFGMAELRFEVAGGSGTEAPLAYLRLDDAHRLRAVLLDRAASVSADPADPVDAAGAAGVPPEGTAAAAPAVPVAPDAPDPSPHTTLHTGPPGAARATPQEREIARVHPTWLVVGTLLSSEFVGSLVLAVLALVVSGVTGEVAGVALVLPALFGAGSALVRGIVHHWGFVLTDTGRGWRLRSGLFDLRSQTVPLDRVQGLALVEPLLWRRLGWVRVQVDVAGYHGTSSGGGPSASTLLPVAPRALALGVLSRLVPGEPATDVPQRGAPPVARWFRPIGWRYLGAGAGDDVVVTTRGWVKRRTDIVPYHKIQSVRVRQGPLQRRLGLLDLTLQTTPGPVEALARHRPVGELADWLPAALERAGATRRGGPPAARDPALSAEPAPLADGPGLHSAGGVRDTEDRL